MADNNKPTPGRGADENYAREVLQLFSIGLVELHSDGTPKLDASGNQIPTYTQDTIEGFSDAFTGWTYAPLAGAVSKFPNPENWNAPMVSFDAHHDTDPGKLLLNGYTLPAGQTAALDLQDTLNNITSHPNVAPFISRQLIQRLVSSNPSPAYVARISSAFSANSGNIGLVVKAILLDPEARAGDDGVTENKATKLREPVLWINTLLRGLNATVVSPNNLPANAANLGQNLYFSPTVFNYFLPGYEINLTETTTYNAPEFQLLSEATAFSAVNIINTLVYGNMTGVTIDLTPYITPLGIKPTSAQIDAMGDSVSQALMGGTAPPAMRSTIITAVSAQTTPKAMVQTAVYLIGSSWDFQVER